MNEDIRIALRRKGYVRQPDGSYSLTDHRDTGMGASIVQRQPSLAREHAPEARSMGAPVIRPRVTITMYRCGKPLDKDNKWIAPKAILDGLVQALELPGDSESQIDYHVEQVRVAHRNEQQTMIEIQEITLAPSQKTE